MRWHATPQSPGYRNCYWQIRATRLQLANATPAGLQVRPQLLEILVAGSVCALHPPPGQGVRQLLVGLLVSDKHTVHLCGT